MSTKSSTLGRCGYQCHFVTLPLSIEKPTGDLSSVQSSLLGSIEFNQVWSINTNQYFTIKCHYTKIMHFVSYYAIFLNLNKVSQTHISEIHPPILVFLPILGIKVRYGYELCNRIIFDI